MINSGKIVNSKEKIRILQFSLAESMGGRTRYILDLWKWVDHSVFHMDFLTFSKKPLSVEEDLKKAGCEVYHLPCYPKDDKELFENAFNSILDRGYDIAHLATASWDDFTIDELVYKKGIKIITHSHTLALAKWTSEEDRVRKERLHYSLLGKLDFNKISGFWACSKAAARWLYGEQIKENELFITHPCIETGKYQYSDRVRSDYRQKLSIKDDEYVIGTVGRLVPVKNQSFIIEVFARAFRGDNRVKLLIAGDGEQSAALKQLVEELEITIQCIFTGRADDTVPFYMAMDVFLLPSLHEGFPRVVMEAASSGLMCFLSDTITAEIEKCGSVRRFPLNMDIWSREIKNHRRVYEGIDRTKGAAMVRNNGLDIRDEIKRIENEYKKVLTGNSEIS